MRRATIFLLCALVATAGITVSSGAFSSVAADRGVSVTVASDENAFVALTTPDSPSATSGDSAELVTVTNQFSEQVTVNVTDITTSDPALTATLDSQPGELGSGDSETAKVTLACDSPVTATISFDVEANGTSVNAKTTAKRSVETTCNT